MDVQLTGLIDTLKGLSPQRRLELLRQLNAEYSLVPPESLNICGAICGDGTRLCRQRPMPNGRCRMHGGKTPAGIAAPRYQNGLYSKYMPKKLRDRYEDLRADTDLTSLDEELSLLTVRISELLESIGEAPPWEMLKAKWKAATHGVELTGPLKEIDEIIDAGVAASGAQANIWSELRQLIQDKTKTASAEWNRLHDLQGLVKLDQVMLMWRGVLEAIRANVSDPVMLRAVTADVLRIMPPPSRDVMPSEVLEG